MQDNTNPNTVLRQALLAKRKALSPERRAELSQELVTLLVSCIERHSQGKRLQIAAFWPIAQELDIKPALRQLSRQGHTISLPKVIELDAPLAFYLWDEEAPMQPGHFNIPEPALTERADMPDLVSVPVLGFTMFGDRLGYGKGYYDRTLALWQSQGYLPYTLGLAWDEGLIEDCTYQAAPHDVPLNAILTPSGFKC